MRAWATIVGPSARMRLLSLSDPAFERVAEVIDLLGATPYLDREYDPSYAAARPPFPCRVAYAGNYGIYYTVDEHRHELYVRFVEDQRANPKTRFTD